MGSTNYWKHAVETNLVDQPTAALIYHHEGQNWLYTILRSILLATPEKLDKVFEYIHYGFEHNKSEQKKKRRAKQEGPEILLYWQEKAAICANCTSFLIQLLSSSWRRSGQALLKQHHCSRRELTLYGFSSEVIDVMTDLYSYMCTAYNRLEKETKDALRAKTHSEGLEDACKEHYGDNFDLSKDSERLEALLTSLHDSTIHSLCTRLRYRHHIDDTLERDKQNLSKRKTSRENQAIVLFEGVESQTKPQAVPTLTKGKNYEQNKRKSEKKKQKRANASKINLVEVSNDPKDSLKETTVGNSFNPTAHLGEIVLMDKNAIQISQDLTVIEQLDTAQNATFTEGINEFSANTKVITLNTASTGRINEVIAKDDVVVSPTAVKQSNKIDCLNSADLSEATDEATDLASQSAVASDSAKNLMARVTIGLISYRHDEILGNAVPIEDEGHWTKVVGRSKKLKRSDANSDDKKSWPVKEGPRFVPRANKPQDGVKLGMTREAAPSPTRRAQTSGSREKKHTLPKAVSKSINFKSIESAKSPKVDVLPSVPEVPTVSNTTFALNTDSNPTSCYSSAGLTTVTPVATAASTAESHSATNKPDLASTSAIIDPATTSVFIAESPFNSKNSVSSSPSESIDPDSVPYYQHLQPHKGKGRGKMSEITDVSFASGFTTPGDAVSLVGSLRDAGVEDNAMSSLVSRGADLATSGTHHLAVPDAVGGRLRAFACKHLDVKRANNSPRSAGNSPIPPHSDREVMYHYPPPDVLTPENQEILDHIIKGPPYPKYPRVPIAVDVNKQITQPLAADFVTKKPSVVTYDGKDAYEVLGDRCPAPLTIKDHPNVNKCIQQGEIFHCAYCRVEILGNAELEKGIICPGCGPCSEIRYCQRSHLLADSIEHSEACGRTPCDYPLMWNELPPDYQSLYPYIKPLTGNMTAQCFRQMAHCLVINSDGIIENPYKALFYLHMSMEHRIKCYDWVRQMYQFQDKGSYYLFHPNTVAGGVDIELTITTHDGSSGIFREDQRFARVRNAAFLTNNPTLLCVIYRRIKDAIKAASPDDSRNNKRLYFFNMQFKEEFPFLDLATVAPLDENYCFENDWKHVRCLVRDLELGNPILRAWITEDAEDDGIPADPTVRYQGKYWAAVLNGPTFRVGSADRKDWGPGWFGGDEKKWQKQLDRKYLKMINDELAKVEVELEGEII